MNAVKTRRYSHETVGSECDGHIRVVETATRDALKLGNRTIAYLAIGAEAWGPLLAASVEMRAALELIELNARTALRYTETEGNDRAAAERLRNILNWPGFRALKAILEKDL